MKKVLLAFDGSNFSEGAFEFARRMNKAEPIMLTGIFLPQVDYANLWSYADVNGGPFLVPLVESEDSEIVKKNVERFQKLCSDNKIESRVHKDFFDFALPELKRESRFSDLIILGSEVFYENLGKREPNEYLTDALSSVECPVVIVPEKFDYPYSNILAYDGSESSVFAIKQFAYLFPDLSRNNTMLITICKEDEKEIPDEYNIRELVSGLYSDLSILKLDVNRKKYFSTWISEKKSAILVSGAYGRSFFSLLFRRSFVSDVIGEHKLPVFVTHR